MHGLNKAKRVITRFWCPGPGKPIKMFYLPSDSAQLNPGQHLHAGLKHLIGSRVSAHSKDTPHAVLTIT